MDYILPRNDEKYKLSDLYSDRIRPSEGGAAPENTTSTKLRKAGSGMDCIIRNVGSHVEVYSRSGVFLFSADNTREAMEELGQAG